MLRRMLHAFHIDVAISVSQIELYVNHQNNSLHVQFLFQMFLTYYIFNKIQAE
jgi:hypothetical protein